MTKRFRKKIAIGFLSFWISNIVLPNVCLALTSGPVQPESAAFTPAGTSDMVDLFTGDFKYNIPLMDVDGYPLNLNYDSGTGMDDEASWVGLGWNVNVGSINRQLRGVPDDMSGDGVETEHYTKPKVTIGGRVSIKGELVGKGKNLVKANGSFSLGVFSDNYTGIGADFGVNAGLSFTNPNGTKLTSGLGVGLNSSTASGVDVSPYISLSIKEGADKKVTQTAGLSASLGFNSRSGMKDLTLSSSYNVSLVTKSKVSVSNVTATSADVNVKTGGLSGSTSASGSAISFNTEPILPNIEIPYKSRYGSFSIDVGPAVQVAFVGVGATGYKSVKEVANPIITNPEYGFLYAERGKNQKNAVMDFIREKENPVIPDIPNLALPVHTPDLFSFTSQGGSGQFRLYRGGSGAFFDNEASDDNDVTTIGGDLGYGFNWHGGITLFKQGVKSTTRKWVDNNEYLSKGDFQDASLDNPNAQHVYFKEVGEKTADDNDMVSKLHGTGALAVSISGKTANAAFTNASLSTLQKKARQKSSNVISYLTADEAAKGGLDKDIPNYGFYNAGSFTPPARHKPIPVSRLPRVDESGYRKKHHLSEMTVTDPDGKRTVYGIPVYNVKQSEYSYAVGAKGKEYNIADNTNNQVPLQVSAGAINHNKGIDNYYHNQTQPAYASSFLLTAILSPDYIDRTNDGITDDDAGTAIKFNYSKLPNLFKWRTPFHNATLNRAMLADPDDDKGSIVYGEKELWYANTIETKTKIAYFITEDRNDALGVNDFKGITTNTDTRQKCLKEIRLYSKADTTRPIKVVKFEYAYELCKNIPNYVDKASGNTQGAKLTLKRVYFEYGNSSKGANHPYTFTYNKTIDGNEVQYGDMQTDRWGVYKASGENKHGLKNDEFPYTNQDESGSHTAKDRADQNAALWHLSKINLPTGGEINVNYESDDYAYVQNKRAMAMASIESLVDQSGNDLDSNSVSYLKDARGIKVKISNTPANNEDQTTWFKKNYLNGSDYIYTKVLTKVATSYSKYNEADAYDFIPCYSKVASVTVSGQYAKVMLEDRNDGGVTANPIIFSAWQTMKNEYPRFAYPGFDRRAGSESAQSSISKAVTAIVSAFSNLSELTQNFYQKAYNKNFAAKVHLDHSFVKLTKQNGFKLGGGVRVKKIRITDDWQGMAGSTNGVTAGYGQAYDYTTEDGGQLISSGVAAYEPAVGSDENPLKQPVPYIQKIKGAIDNFFDLEEPFGESFFPAPTVGYSKVTVTDLDKYGNPDPGLRTGYTVNEFYTAKDFPVHVTVLPIQSKHNKPVNYLSFVGATSIDELCMSQGYSIELNDMHGKAKAVRSFNSSRSEIASTVYQYNAEISGGGEMRLKNVVDLVNPDGSISTKQVIGRDIEFFTDFRENESKNEGHSYNLGADLVGFGWFSFPLPHFPNADNSDYKLFRSACAVKVSTYYGIVDKVIKTENGSSITTENMAYDGMTGKALVTRTQNEFEKYIYSLSLPAYWAYKGMSGAYQNQGTVFKNFITNSKGEPNYSTFLTAGDELVDINTGTKYWVVENKANPGQSTLSKKLINIKGQLISYFNAAGLMKLVRSGYRNMLDQEVTNIVSLNNPLRFGRLAIVPDEDMTSLAAINASAVSFNQSWPMELSNNPSDSTRVENTSAIFTFGSSTPNSNHGTDGALLLDPAGNRTVQTTFLKKGLDRCGIWLNPPNSQYLGRTLGFETSFYIASDGDYSIGYMGDDDYQYTIDNISLANLASSGYWIVKPQHLTKGTHYLVAQCTNLPLDSGSPDNNSSNPGAIGIEIYNNSLTQLENAPSNGSGIQTLFSTRSLVNDPDLQSFQYINGVKVYRFTYRRFTNPYIGGYLGNWRARESKVFQQSRYNNTLVEKGSDVRQAGYIQNFSSYWFYGALASGGLGWQTNLTGNRARWVTANTITSYDKYGQQLENKDALNRYSAAKFVFNGELPAAVASNAMNREIYAGSFEDVLFTPGTVADTTKAYEFVNALTHVPLSQLVTGDYAHSGNYSVLLPSDGIQLNTRVHNKTLGIDSLLIINEYGEYNTRKDVGVYPNGFEPKPSGKYIFNAWIKDNHATDKSVNVTVSVNGVNIPLTCKALVEDWKLMEGTIITGPASDNNGFSLLIKPGDAAVYVDDIRIHPFDSHMKTYVYDDKTMRLMAELDENGFATFYEYDDEGLLIRVKKETERGIMTLKESRSSYRKIGS